MVTLSIEKNMEKEKTFITFYKSKREMKIGILTFHDTINYGAVFQMYALQKVINDNSQNTCEVIDYRCEKISAQMRLNRMINNHSLKGRLKTILAGRFYKNRNEKFTRFRNRFCNISADTYTKENIRKSNFVYDCYISGSDQIFNLNLTGNDLTYYLDFVFEKKLKIAYGASTGNFSFEHAPSCVSQLINRFTSISCREQTVADDLAFYYGVNSSIAVDPTFLLPQNCWIELEEKLNMPDKYILLYLVSPKKEYLEFASKVGKTANLPVCYINYTYKKIYMKNIKNFMDVSPENFLYLIHHATYVLTNSFHGTAMSIIYEKNFSVIYDQEREKGNQRIIDILDKLGLKSCCVAVNEDIELKNVNYLRKRKVLPSLIDVSMNFLKDSGVI